MQTFPGVFIFAIADSRRYFYPVMAKSGTVTKNGITYHLGFVRHMKPDLQRGSLNPFVLRRSRSRRLKSLLALASQ